MSPENVGNDERLQNFQNIMEQFKNSNKSEKYPILVTMMEALKQDPRFQEEFYQDAKKRFQAFKVSTYLLFSSVRSTSSKSDIWSASKRCDFPQISRD